VLLCHCYCLYRQSKSNRGKLKKLSNYDGRPTLIEKGVMIRQRKTTQLLSTNSNEGDSDYRLPHHTKSSARIVRSGKSSSAIFTQWSRCHRPRSNFSWLLFLIGFLLVIIVALDRIWVSISLGYSYPNHKQLAKAVSPTVSLDKTNIAIVSIHEGFKFHGSLGQFLRDSKRSYAGLHGYAFIDESFPLPDDDYNNKLPDWMKVGNRKVYYKKLRLILFLLEKYHNLDWVMLIDGDAIVTQPYISIEDRLEEFKELYSHKNQHNELSFIWAADSQPNSGVLLVRNVPVGREYLKAALNTWEENDFFKSYTDQSSLIRAAQVNQTFSNFSLLLETEQATLMQSRVRGPTSGLWRPGHWILHLPNHNYLELLSSLRDVGSQLATSPPPIFRPIERPSLESLSRERRDRFEHVQAAIRHAWRGYVDVCLLNNQDTKYLGSHIPLDDLSPMSGHGHDWLYHAATLYDSLDTLALAFGVESNEYKQALQIILQKDLQASALRPTKTFEYSLRILGGLLGAFSLTGDARLLSRARDAADALIQGPFASSPTALPRMFDVLYPPRGGNLLYKVYSKLYEWGRDVFTNEHHYNSLAGVGSFSLEFVFLSQILGTDKYGDAANNIFRHLQRYHGKDGTIPSFWNVMTGEPVNSQVGLGSGSDSFVEYLLKVPLLSCNKSVDGSLACDIDHSVLNEMIQLYHQILNLTLKSKHTVTKEGDTSIAYPVDNLRYHQLLCFLPGLIALEPAVRKQVADEEGGHKFALATSLVEGCHEMYHQSPLGLGPEELMPNQKVDPPVGGDLRYLLRPEYVESLFVMYRRTGNQKYQEMGWEVFQSLERFCKTDLGYAGIKNVYKSDDIERIDDMPSYFVAETLKYLLLLFGPDDFVTLDQFVFTTEAHPLRRLQGKEIPKKFLYFQTELASNKTVQAPFPWFLAALLAVSGIFVVLATILTKKIVLTFVRCLFILYRHTTIC